MYTVIRETAVLFVNTLTRCFRLAKIHFLTLFPYQRCLQLEGRGPTRAFDKGIMTETNR
jgi:hypothetical protein